MFPCILLPDDVCSVLADCWFQCSIALCARWWRQWIHSPATNYFLDRDEL